MPKSVSQQEWGDFQTPPALARQIIERIAGEGCAPLSLVEPTCGVGNVLAEALMQFPHARQALGLDVCSGYLDTLQARLKSLPVVPCVMLQQGDFFTFDWHSLFTALPEPILVTGNPPWVTSADLSRLQSDNRPEKSNFQGRSGLDARTGKANFDISEWMLIRLMEAARHKQATFALLCKATVARKVLAHALMRQWPVARAAFYEIDAARHFGAAVEAGLLLCDLSPGAVPTAICHWYLSLDAACPARAVRWSGQEWISDGAAYEQWGHLQAKGTPPAAFRWRSGVKHDAARVMEFRRGAHGWTNGAGEAVDLEDTYCFPLVKTASLAAGKVSSTDRRVLVPQTFPGQDTAPVEQVAPRTWNYLQTHAALLNSRKSSIYRNRPPYSVFGVGPYTFAPWKVAVSGFYDTLRFSAVGPVEGKPVMLDDASYFLPFENEVEARLWAARLNDVPAQQFFRAFLFPGGKRPVTAELLHRLDLARLR